MSSLLDLPAPVAAATSATKSGAAGATTKLRSSTAQSGVSGAGDSFRESMARESHSARQRESAASDKGAKVGDKSPPDKTSHTQNENPDAATSASAPEGKATSVATAAESTAVDESPAAASDTQADMIVAMGQPPATPAETLSYLKGGIALAPTGAEAALRGDSPLAATADKNVAIPVVTVGAILQGADKGIQSHQSQLEPAPLFPTGALKAAGDTAQHLTLEKAGVDTQPGLKTAEAYLTPITQGSSVARNMNFAKMLNMDGQSVQLDAAASLVAETSESRLPSTFANAHGANPLSAFHTAFHAVTADAQGARMQVPVNISFGQPQWATMVAERSAWLFSQNISSAELMLDPPELGRMSVQIQVHNNEQATVTFTSANHSVRDALDQTTQRLRELLAEQGLDLVNVDVSDRQAADEQNPQNSPRGGASPLTGEGDAGAEEDLATGQIMVNVGIDHYV